MPELRTEDIDNQEIFATGRWNNDDYSEADLDAIIEAHGKVGFKPPIKLGHSDAQKLLKDVGLPAAGWVENLRRSGSKLIADFKRVPGVVADLIRAGGLRKKSAEIYWDYLDEKSQMKLPRVLKAISLLGTEIPAVTSLGDIVALYKKSPEGPAHAFEDEGNEFRLYGMGELSQLHSPLDENRMFSRFREMLDSALSAFKRDGDDELKKYTIEKRGDEYCLIAGTGKVLGCHKTRGEAEAQERAAQANKHADSGIAKIIFGGGLTIEVGGEGGIEKEYEIPWTVDRRGNYAVNLPEGTVSALCDKFGEDEGFRTRCMPWAEGQEMENPGAFCNALKQECFAATQRAKQYGRNDMKLNLTREEVSKLCPPCAREMELKGILALNFTADQVAKFAEHGDLEKCMAKADMVEKYPDENKRKTACEKAVGEALMQAIQETKGGPIMDEKKFEQEKAQLIADKKAADDKAKEYERKLATLEAANEEAKGKESEALKEVKKLKRERWDDQISSWIAAQKRAGKLAPVEEPRLAAIFSVLYEDQRTVTFAQADGKEAKEPLADAIKAFIVGRPSIFKVLSAATDEPTEPLADAGEEVDRKTKEHMAKTGMKAEQYAQAMKTMLALKENEDLAIRYVRMEKQ